MSQSKITPTLDTVMIHVPPEELEKYLFSRMDRNTLKAARCVNKLWQSKIDPMMKFKLELSDSTKKYVEGFGNARKVTSLVTTGFQGRYPEDGIALNTEMVRITVSVTDGFGTLRDTNRSKKNRNKKIGLSPYNFRRFMQDFRFVSKFHIASLAVKSFGEAKDILGRVHLPNVEEMIITFFDGGFLELLPFMKNYFPKLKAVNIANVAETRKDRPILYSWVFGFVGRHRGTLSDVSLILPEGMLDDRGSYGGVLGPPTHGNRLLLTTTMNVRKDLRDDLKTSPHIYEELKYRLEATTTLSKLIWDTSMLEGHRRYNLGSTLLLAQTRLTELHLDNLHLKDVPLWAKIGELLPKISETLKELSLGGCFCGGNSILGTHVFNCSWLSKCNRLKYLEMVVCGVSVEAIDQLPTQSITFLNFGHLLLQRQIEYLAQNMIKLESWFIPQRGCLVNLRIPPVTCYLFKAVLYLPNLTKISVSTDCADIRSIMEFVRDSDGISPCCNNSLMPNERHGNVAFHIDRKVFIRDHSELGNFLEENRENSLGDMDHEDLIGLIINNLMGERLEVEVDDDDEDALLELDDEDDPVYELALAELFQF